MNKSNGIIFQIQSCLPHLSHSNKRLWILDRNMIISSYKKIQGTCDNTSLSQYYCCPFFVSRFGQKCLLNTQMYIYNLYWHKNWNRKYFWTSVVYNLQNCLLYNTLNCHFTSLKSVIFCLLSLQTSDQASQILIILKYTLVNVRTINVTLLKPESHENRPKPASNPSRVANLRTMFLKKPAE